MVHKTSIELEWDQVGHIRHRISGFIPPPPRNDTHAWVLAPSAPLLLAHQLGTMKPSRGLISSGWVLDTLFENRHVLMPINSALKSAHIDFIYTGAPSIRLEFHPQHALFANSDSLEEGACQLVNNYYYYVCAQLDEYLLIVVKGATIAVTGAYYAFLQDELAAGRIGHSRDQWTPAFSILGAFMVEQISEKFGVPQGGRTLDNEAWAQQETARFERNLPELKRMRMSILSAMGMN